ncbi:hypothetical protein [Pseudonocardia sp.]|uniref:hypothetical protein n=1 Tax=Pseudonocardia sp. TaxID=60912 RepID=UPI0026331C42|nr:hypothetical protein [Pseudonocardia sp.]
MAYSERRRSGRHAFDEDAALTPIFHALNRGGWRGRQQEPAARPADAVDEFRRDPLTAPIPVQSLAAPTRPAHPTPPARRRRPAAHALVEPRAGGRHHFRLEGAGHR